MRWGLIALLTLLPSAASAFHPLTSFGESANEGGGAGFYFTGSPRWKGYNCRICHVDSAGEISFSISSTPPELFADNVWTPGATYQIAVRLEGEHNKRKTNPNAFLAELLADDLTAVGTFSGRDLQPVRDTPGVIAGRAEQDQTEWSFELLAPGAGAGRLSLYLAGVDGNGAGVEGDADEELQTDALGDDVFVGQWRFCEAGTSCDTTADARRSGTSPASWGCRATPGDASASAAASAAMLLVLLGLLVRKRRATLVAVALCGMTASCFDPVLPRECTNRICDAGGASGLDSGERSDASFMPMRCQCVGCASDAECHRTCQPDPGLRACYYPAEGGCWLVAGSCR